MAQSFKYQQVASTPPLALRPLGCRHSFLRMNGPYKGREGTASKLKEDKMKRYITTIEELKGKPKSELNVIFRKAVEVAASDKVSPHVRKAAKLTVENVRRNL